MVVATGEWEGLFLVTHLPDLQNHFARRGNYETAIRENHETNGRDETRTCTKAFLHTQCPRVLDPLVGNLSYILSDVLGEDIDLIFLQCVGKI